MDNKYKFLFTGSYLSLFLMVNPIIFVDAATSKVTGEIIPGVFSLTTPNDLNFSATLKGHKQTIDLKSIQTKITDYRGQEEGWQLTVKSSNFDKYAQNYQLVINGQLISHDETIVYKTTNQTLIKEISLPVKAEISANAQAGSYGVNLEWNLQPTIKNSIKE